MHKVIGQIWLIGMFGLFFIASLLYTDTIADVQYHMPSEQGQDNSIFEFKSSDVALPIEVSRVRVNTVNLSARQLTKQISQSVFGAPASQRLTSLIVADVELSHAICLSLPPSQISYPFNVFW